MVEIFDNLLTNEETNHIESFLRDPKFPWFLSIGHNHFTTDLETITNNSNKFSTESVLLGHTFYLDMQRNSDNHLVSDFILNRFLDRTSISFKSLLRSKANLQLVTKENNLLYTTPHVDNYSPHTVLIYYVNDCDGDTFIFDDHKTGSILKQVSPKKGRFLMFDGKYYHAAGLPKSSNFRLNVNFNYE
jgi:hypothetical protein